MSKGLISIVIFLGIIAVGAIAVWPAYQTTQESLGALKLKEVELETKGAYYDNINALYKESENYANELAKVNSAIPEKNSVASLFQFVQQIGSENGMVLKDIGTLAVSSSADKPRIKEIRFDFTVLGSYPAFRNFLATLEKSSRLIDVESISIPQEKTDLAGEDSGSITGGSLSESGSEVFLFNIKIITRSY